jgi:hypothetical protein
MSDPTKKSIVINKSFLTSSGSGSGSEQQRINLENKVVQKYQMK